MTRFAIRAAAGVLALGLLTACGDDAGEGANPDENGDDTPAATEPEAEGSACPLTTDDVTAAIGQEMTESGDCDFRAADGTFVEVYVARVGSEVFGADEPTAVEDVGDEAYVGPSGELYVRFGDEGYQIQVMAASGVDGDAAEIELAHSIGDVTE